MVALWAASSFRPALAPGRADRARRSRAAAERQLERLGADAGGPEPLHHEPVQELHRPRRERPAAPVRHPRRHHALAGAQQLLVRHCGRVHLARRRPARSYSRAHRGSTGSRPRRPRPTSRRTTFSRWCASTERRAATTTGWRRVLPTTASRRDADLPRRPAGLRAAAAAEASVAVAEQLVGDLHASASPRIRTSRARRARDAGRRPRRRTVDIRQAHPRERVDGLGRQRAGLRSPSHRS